MSKAFSAKGTVTSFGPVTTGGSQTYPTTLSEMKTIQFGSQKANLEDVTNMDSPSGYVEELPTTLDAGDVTFSGNRVAADPGQSYLLTAFGAQTLLAVKVQLPKGPNQTTNGDVFTFEGYCVDIGSDFQYDKAASWTGKIRITGPLNLAPGS